LSQQKPRKPEVSRQFVGAVAGSYFLLYAGGFLWTYLPKYLEALGWTGAAIGTLYSARSLLKTVALPLWANVADRTGVVSRVVHIQLFIGAVTLATLPFVELQWTIGLVIALQAAFAGATIPMLDAMTLSEVGADGYGRIRAWGSVGFGVLAATAAAFGIWSTHGELAALSPWGLGLSWVLTFFVGFAYPKEKTEVDTPTLRETVALLNRPALLAMMPIAALHWMSIQPYNMFLVFLSDEKGFGAWTPGAAVVFGITFETLAFSASAKLLERARPTALLLFAVGVTAVRWWLTGWVDDQWAMMALQGLHGISFGVFYVAAMAFVDREVDQSVRASGQALFYFVVFGIGTALGSFLAGLVIDLESTSTLYRWTGYFELGVLVLGACLIPILRGDDGPETAA
jgi:PPP family 3-phenylpropionic acid transporter